MTATSPFVWLKDLCTHFDWLHAGSQALAEGRPLPPSDVVPDHAIGEIMRAFHRIDETLRSRQDELDALRRAAEAHEHELTSARSEAESARGNADAALAALERIQHAIDDRQRGWDEMESKWLHDRLLLEQRIGDLDQRLRAITGRLKDHAHVLQTVAADLTSAAS
jgi:chromosome segregation ATPase